MIEIWKKSSSILRSSIAISVIVIASKVLGYFEKIILAYHFGTGFEVDVYNTVLTFILSVFVIFREVIEPGFLNTFLRGLELKEDKKAWDIFAFFLKSILIISFLLSAFVCFKPTLIVDLLAPGLISQKKELAASLIKIGFPACIFLSLSALTNITLNALKKFAFSASGELIFKSSILLSLILLFKYYGIFASIIGVLIGSILKLFIHLLMLYKNISFKGAPNKAYLKSTWKLSWPIIIGILFSQIGDLIDNIFASFQQVGAISALSYSKKIIELPVLIFPYVLSIVVFPYFSQLSMTKNRDKLSSLFLQCISWIVIIFLPLSVFFYIFSYEIVEVVFKRGAFNEYSTILTAWPLKLYSTGMVFTAVETVLVIFYFANSNTRTPIFIGIVCVVEEVILTNLLINLMGYAGIALAFVLAKATKNLVLIVLLKDTLTLDLRYITFMYKLVVGSISMGGIILAAKFIFQDASASAIEKAGFLALTFLAGTITYIFTLFLLRIKKQKRYL